MLHARLAPLGACAGLALLAACGDSASGPNGGLSDAELVSLMVAASSTSQGGGTSACPGGGEVSGTGSSNSSTNGDITTWTFDLDVDYNACGYPHQQRTVFLDGQISFGGTFRVQAPQSGPSALLEAEYEYAGTLRWHGDGLDLTCAIDVTSTYQPSANRYSVVGRVCGRDVSQTITL